MAMQGVGTMGLLLLAVFTAAEHSPLSAIPATDLVAVSVAGLGFESSIRCLDLHIDAF